MSSQGAQSGPLSALPSLIPSTLRLRTRAIEKRELKIKCPDKVVEKNTYDCIAFNNFPKMYSDQLASLTISTELKLKIFLK